MSLAAVSRAQKNDKKEVDDLQRVVYKKVKKS